MVICNEIAQILETDYSEIARKLDNSCRRSVLEITALLQAIQLGYNLAKMEQKEKPEE